mgnify:FL=1|jgi:hypothetical protein
MPVDCTNPAISEQELINSLLVKIVSGPNAGLQGLRVKRVSVSAAIIEPVIGCANIPLGNGEYWKRAIGLSADNKPAIILIEES